FEFTAVPGFNFFHSFTEKFNLKPAGDTLTLPPKIGKGTIKKIEFGSDFRLLIHRYKMKEEFIIKRKASPIKHDLISIFFYHNEFPVNALYNDDKSIQFSKNNDSAIQVTTSDLNSEIRFPANTDIYFTVVGITSSRLSSLLRIDKPNPLIKKITSGIDSFLLFESIATETLRILKQLTEISDQDELKNFYYQIKVEELLYQLFTKLLSREPYHHKPINNADVEKLMIIRNAILADISQPPVLHVLAELGSMSETKMKHLFKQTFGDTIYNYYLNARMEEAAFLLRHAGLSVSEVGYQLGFSNLSHFSRLFEKYYQVTPKKYALAG
ncbi:MAG TPA: AraC family transcriptional regulator, partial [Cyclobacteriaceae bacterium]